MTGVFRSSDIIQLGRRYGRKPLVGTEVGDIIRPRGMFSSTLAPILSQSRPDQTLEKYSQPVSPGYALGSN